MNMTEETTGAGAPLTVIGAKWCGYSKKQFAELGCTDEGCQAKFKPELGGDNVNFVWCQDEQGNAINTDLDECKVEGVKGYPTWLEPAEQGKFKESSHRGYIAPCKMSDYLDPDNLKCQQQAEAAQFCQQQAEKAKADENVKSAMAEVEAFKSTVQTEMEAKAKAVELAAETYMGACKARMQEAQPFQ